MSYGTLPLFVLDPSVITYESIVHTTLGRPLAYDELKAATRDGRSPLHCLILVSMDEILDSDGSLGSMNDTATEQAFGAGSVGGTDYRFTLVGVKTGFQLSKVSANLAGVGVFLFFCGDVSDVLDEMAEQAESKA